MRRTSTVAWLVALACFLWCGLASAKPIRLWHAYRGAEERALNAILAKWKGEPVETLSVPYDAFGSKLAAAIPLGEGPDLYIDQHERLGDYHARGIAAPVGDALEPDGFSPPALLAVTIGGVAYGIPLSQKCVALYMNTDLAKEVPEYLESIADLRASLPDGTFPLAYEAPNAYMHAAILASFGGDLLHGDDEYGFAGEPAVRSLVFVTGLIDRKVIPEDPDGSLVKSLFSSGHAAFAISGPWFAGDLGDKPDLHYRVVPLPKIHATGEPMRPLLTVESIMLAPSGAARPDVRALARLIAGKDAAMLRASEARSLTARSDVPIPEKDDFLAAFSKQARAAVPMPSSIAMRAVWEPVNRAIRKVLRHDALPDVAIAEGKKRYDDVRRPLPPARSPAPFVVVLGLFSLAMTVRWLGRAKKEHWGDELRRSLPAYRYVLHAVLVVGVLVILPLVIGAATSLFAGSNDERRYVGLANFISILTARGMPLLSSGSFYLVLLVTILWTAVNLTLHVSIGVALGLLLSRPTMRLRGIYRVLLIIPWAVPSYVTALAWKGMFHRQYGAVTALILAANHLFGTHVEPIAWFSRFSTAFTANVATNAWLGFPFMMVVTLGALTAIPNEVIEAAKVDGATRWQRLRLVILPMIRPTMMPAVTLGAIWTFNMFNVVFLVSGGDPDGTTDILVSEAYRWAFTRQAQYGYAAAYAVLIFLLLSFATRVAQKRHAIPEAP